MRVERTIPARPPMTPEQLEKKLQWVAAWEKADCPAFPQDCPMNVKDIYDAFAEDYTSAEKTYISSHLFWKLPRC